MKATLLEKLDSLAERYDEVGHLLSDPEVIGEQNRFRTLSIEYAELEPVVKVYQRFAQLSGDIESARHMLKDDDADMRELAEQEISGGQAQLPELEQSLQTLLLPKDPNDKCNVFLEIRAGTGGDEAAIFTGDLFRMYSRYADSQNWQVEIVNERFGDHGGYKEIIARIVGKQVFSRLKFESGAHRVQRVPETESQGRVHTSACTVAILPEVDELEAVEINKADLRVDTYRASGAGGQHVNKTDSAVRLTHLPTGIVVECQDERSQHKNKARAMSLLQARILSGMQEQQSQEQSDLRRSLVGSGDRSERIRTYNYPQGRITDHRINLTLYKIDEITEGDLNQVIEPLINEYQTEQLAALAE